jgi:hypothetical protein
LPRFHQLQVTADGQQFIQKQSFGFTLQQATSPTESGGFALLIPGP